MNINGENSNNISGNEMVTENGKIENSGSTNKSEMVTENGKIENSGSTNKSEMFALKPAFLQILQSVGAKGVTFTFAQVLEHMQNYIYSRRLFDPLNPRTIHCKDDELGNVLGVQKFTISDVINLLRTVLFRLPHPDKNGSASNLDGTKRPVPGSTSAASNLDGTKRPAPGSTSAASNLDGTKRPAPVASDDASKRVCLDAKGEEEPKPTRTFFICIPDPPKADSASETELSIQGYETSYVKNSSYDSWFSDDDCDLEEEDNFSVEYDVRSLSSDNASVVSDTDSDIADILHATIILRKNDTDMEFWADDSSDDSSDPEMSEGDKWSCSSCGSLNRPPMRFCQCCWEVRIGWLSSKRLHQHPPRNLRRRQRSELLSSQKIIEKLPENVEGNSIEHDVNSELLATTGATICSRESSIDSTTSKNDGILLDPVLEKETSIDSGLGGSQLSLRSAAAAICPLCLHRQKTATIIHGRTGHQTCCYPCARHLESKKLPCPICRRTIQKVVRNYIV